MAVVMDVEECGSKQLSLYDTHHLLGRQEKNFSQDCLFGPLIQCLVPEDLILRTINSVKHAWFYCCKINCLSCIV